MTKIDEDKALKDLKLQTQATGSLKLSLLARYTDLKTNIEEYKKHFEKQEIKKLDIEPKSDSTNDTNLQLIREAVDDEIQIMSDTNLKLIRNSIEDIQKYEAGFNLKTFIEHYFAEKSNISNLENTITQYLERNQKMSITEELKQSIANNTTKPIQDDAPQNFQEQKDQATDKILTIFNNMLRYKEETPKINQYGLEKTKEENPYFGQLEGYYFLTDIGKSEFASQICSQLKISQLKISNTDDNRDLIEKMGTRLNHLAGDISNRKKLLKKEDLDVGAWDIIKAVLMVVFLPITIIPITVNAALGDDICDVQTKMKLKSKVGTLLEKRVESNNNITQR